jgi:hypothetical protein
VPPPPPAGFDLLQCARNLANSIPPSADPISVERLSDLSGLCFKNLYNQTLLEDFLARQGPYKQQLYLDVILLWMVVFITISGILLSGLQLLTSYRLALAKKPDNTKGELIVQSNRLTLRSSVVGLFILALSLLFFIIYVYGVYTIKPAKDDSIENLHSISYGSTGGIGKPPTQPVSTPTSVPAVKH